MTPGGPTPHISWRELACADGTPYPSAWRIPRAVPLALEFEEIRRRCGGKPITILSAFRTREHNRRVGGARLSQHPEGRALDLSKVGIGIIRLWEVANDVAKERGVIRGLGLYPWGVHIDTRPAPRLAVWHGGRSFAELLKP